MISSSGKRHVGAKRETSRSVASALLEGGGLAELVYDHRTGQTSFAVWKNGDWYLIAEAGRSLFPFSAENNLIRHDVVLLPSRPEDFGSQNELIKHIRSFIHTYVDLDEDFEHLASYYVLFTWLHDSYNELPYLRVQGNYGTGKTRFLQIVGSICYRPIFANGASTVSPIFHMLDAFGGTLIIDEADFRYSDEKADIVKIFNNGNVQGMPVLRSQVTREREFDPRVFKVFGPKIVAMRGGFDDAALESRFVTEKSEGRDLREDIPINLPPAYRAEALSLRNKLLAYRFQKWASCAPSNDLADQTLDARTNQILVPLLSIVEDQDDRERLRKTISNLHEAHWGEGKV